MATTFVYNYFTILTKFSMRTVTIIIRSNLFPVDHASQATVNAVTFR